MMMNQMLLVCTIAAGSFLMLDAAYLQPNDASAKNSETAQRSQQEDSNDIRAYYMERYSPGQCSFLIYESKYCRLRATF